MLSQSQIEQVAIPPKSLENYLRIKHPNLYRADKDTALINNKTQSLYQ